MPHVTSNRALIAAAMGVALCLPLPVFASWVMPSDAPVDRLVKNAQAWVDENPKDPRGYFVLGRIHSYAYELNTNHLRAKFSDEEAGQKLPNIITNPDIQIGPRPEEKEKRLTEEERRKHLTESITHFRKAAEFHKTSGMTRLGLGYTLDIGAAEAAHLGLPPGAEPPAELTPAQRRMYEPWIKGLSNPNEATRASSEDKLISAIEQAISLVMPLRESKDEMLKAAAGRLLAAYWREMAIKEYLLAYESSAAADLKDKLPKVKNNWDLRDIVSLEASRYCVKLINDRKPKPAERAKLAQMTALVKKFEDAQTEFVVTPIILHLTESRGLPELLAPDVKVKFNLDGTGRDIEWEWVKPDTGLLVWDPAGQGHITSGRQLFGTVTWWMFWRDGYHALNSLDDNRDGELRGEELKGLAVWFDRNSNGKSDPGEVIPVAKLDIESIATSATSHARDKHQSPANPQGLRMKDGRLLPTYDWVAEGVRGKAAASGASIPGTRIE